MTYEIWGSNSFSHIWIVNNKDNVRFLMFWFKPDGTSGHMSHNDIPFVNTGIWYRLDV